MLLLPIPLLRALQMPISQKVVLGIIFSIGSAYVNPSQRALVFHLRSLTTSFVTVSLLSAPCDSTSI
jgi:hypothetical protein